jgi:hypothetical protein
MYGTSSDNVYIVGHNAVNNGKMYHYDGTTWSPVPLSHIPGAIDLHDIAGTSANDIWASGEEIYFDPVKMQFLDSSLVIHFDGVRWAKVAIPKGSALYAISAGSPEQVLAGSSKGTILQFDGTIWKRYELGEELFVVSIASLSPSEGYAVINREDRAIPVDSAGYFLYAFDGNRWSVIDSIMLTPGAPPGHFGLELSAWEGNLYSSGSNVYRRVESQWELVIEAQVGHMWMSAPENIIAVGRGLYHYNGVDWKEFSEIYPIPVGFDCYTNGEEVFVVSNDNSKTFILHGE